MAKITRPSLGKTTAEKDGPKIDSDISPVPFALDEKKTNTVEEIVVEEIVVEEIFYDDTTKKLDIEQKLSTGIQKNNLLSFDNVVMEYSTKVGKTVALDNVNFNVKAGEFVFLVGASGSGKSTILRLLIREEKPTSGEVYVAGENLATLSKRGIPALRRQIGTVFQDFRLLSDRTVEENIAFALQVLGEPEKKIKVLIPHILDLVGLSGKADRYPNELSGGEQQRAAIARAFVAKPPILVADEPTGNLDPETSKDIVTLLNAINLAGTTVIMATHDSTIVDGLNRRVIELSEGSIIRDEKQGSYQASTTVWK